MLLSIVSMVLIFTTAASALDQWEYQYNFTVIFKPGGTDQTGQLSLLFQGKPPQRRIVNLNGDYDPLPPGMVQGYGVEVDYVPANEVTGVHICWFEMAHGKTWNGTILFDKIIVDPEYLKDRPNDRKMLTIAFCPDPKDIPLKSWKYIILKNCPV